MHEASTTVSMPGMVSRLIWVHVLTNPGRFATRTLRSGINFTKSKNQDSDA